MKYPSTTLRHRRLPLRALLELACSAGPSIAVCLALTACMAVHTGARWVPVRDGARITVFRDNPPLGGALVSRNGSFVTDSTLPAPSPPTRRFVWDRVDLRFDRSSGATFRDSRNPEGLLGAGPAGNPGSRRLNVLWWHSNGLQLTPGVPVSLHAQERVFEGAPYNGRWVWRDVGDSNATVVLDQGTRIVGVQVVVVTEPGGRSPRMDRAMAELWFDGRTIDRVSASSSNGGSLNSFVVDYDPRSSLNLREDADPREGRLAPIQVQDPDAVWSVCGERYGRNVQFKLVRYGEVASTVVSQTCATAASDPGTHTEACVGGWVSAAAPPNAPPAIPIVVVDHYGGRGVAQSYPRRGVLYGERDVLANIGARHPENTVAHEIGHYLGGDALFFDGAFGPSNLMADGSRNLTREQCEAAHRNAEPYQVR